MGKIKREKTTASTRFTPTGSEGRSTEGSSSIMEQSAAAAESILKGLFDDPAILMQKVGLLLDEFMT